MKYVFVALMTATFSLSAAELTHRWSFNEDWSDSVGGVDAVKCGTYVSLYGGKVHLGYGNCNWGWVLDQGATMIQSDYAAELIVYLMQKGRRNF